MNLINDMHLNIKHGMKCFFLFGYFNCYATSAADFVVGVRNNISLFFFIITINFPHACIFISLLYACVCLLFCYLVSVTWKQVDMRFFPMH